MEDYENNLNEHNKTESLNETDHETNHEMAPKGKQEDYRFVKEVIKEKPVDVRGLFIKGAAILAGAVVFGLVSALVFVRFLPIVQEKMPGESKIVFAEDDPTATPSPVAKDETEAIDEIETADEINQSNHSNGLDEANVPEDAQNSDGRNITDGAGNRMEQKMRHRWM